MHSPQVRTSCVAGCVLRRRRQLLSLGESSQINIDSALDTGPTGASATAPANAATVKLIAVFVSPNGDPPNDLGAVFVDAASLEEGEATGPSCGFDALENEGFEDGFDCWQWFGNSYAVSDVFSQNGTGAAQVYGEFNGSENYSGFFQDFDTAAPGDTVTFSGFAYSDSNDSIAGTTNRVVIKFDWVRADGSIDYGASAEVNITSEPTPSPRTSGSPSPFRPWCRVMLPWSVRHCLCSRC